MNKMSDDQIRIKIAEAMGWEHIRKGQFVKGLIGVFKGRCSAQLLPDWPADLNACHEFEKTLTVTQCVEYDRLLTAIQCRDNVEAEGKTECEADYSAFHAKAPQRCEAFLKVKGLL